VRVRQSHRGFTLVELLVVIGIIALLIAMLMPSLARARQQAKWVQCQSNMRECGVWLTMYANQWRGWVYPPGLGAGKPKDERWPVFVFKPAVYNPPVMTCPNDFEPKEEHTYILNAHLADRGIKFGSKDLGGLTSSDVVVMGEKVTDWNDYYMNAASQRNRIGDYGLGKVDVFKHGPRLGSNYLFLDLHVGTFRDSDDGGKLDRKLDPWDIPSETHATTQP
jgi:prepilin-type N-terminal cleavage/methylation domain-containing protein/prepilin-type processing-associated H-X9-DG protein